MTLADTLGFCAAILTTIAFLPQAIMVIKAKNTQGLSISMYSMFTAGVSMWMTYGILTQAWPVAISNAMTLTLAVTILSLLIKDKLARSPLRLKEKVHALLHS